MQRIYKDNSAVWYWLFLCTALVVLMVLVGGYTRLSGSGLSITQWKPIHGVIPPLGLEQWQEEFAAYQQSPQYQKINMGMTLEEFKSIYWPEYMHRLLGRLIGMVFFIPLVVFALRRSISRQFGWRLAGIFALGGLQGLMGWLMVASGLVDNPHVSHIRLAAHLILAFALFALLLWAVLDTKNETPARPAPNAYSLWFALLCLQVILGALLAGLHGGLIYNTWPTMNGEWISSDIAETPGVMENIPLIQFLHRTLAVLVAGGFLLWWHWQWAYVKNNHLGKVCAGVTAVIALQFILGVFTLLFHVPLPLALAHQMTGLLLFGLAVILLHMLRHDRLRTHI